MQNQLDSTKPRCIISLKLFGVDIGWESARDCLIDCQTLQESVLNKSSQLNEYLKNIGLLKNFRVKFHFAESDTRLEVLTVCSNQELFEKEEAVREELHRRFVWCRDSLISGKTTKEIIDNQPSKTLPLSYSEIEAFKKLLKGPANSKMEIDFFSAGKEIIQFQKMPPVEASIVDEHETEEISVDVRFFDDELLKVTLFNLMNSSGYVAGQVTLEVNVMADRTSLLTSQLNFNPVKVKLSPARDARRPGKLSRAGRLINIVSFGEANSNLW